MIVMLRAERLHRLVDQPLVRIDLLRRGGQLRRRIADDVQAYARAERDLAAIVRPRDQRRIHQDFVAGHRIVDLAARSDRSGEARSRPSSRSARSPTPAPGSAARNSRRDTSTATATECSTSRASSPCGPGWPRSRETYWNSTSTAVTPCGHRHVEGEDVDRIALPLERPAVRREPDARDVLDVAAGVVPARHPLGIKSTRSPAPVTGTRCLIRKIPRVTSVASTVSCTVPGNGISRAAGTRVRLGVGLGLAVERRDELGSGRAGEVVDRIKASAIGA